MMKKYFLNLCLVLVGVMLFSCEKDENLIEKVIEIEVLNPTAQTVIELNGTLSINVTVSANFELHGYEWKIYPFQNQNNIIASKNEHVHGKSIVVNDTWQNNSVSNQELILEFTAIGDHSGENFKKAFVQFTVN